MEGRKQKIVIWIIYLICGLFFADPGKEKLFGLFLYGRVIVSLKTEIWNKDD